MKAKMDKRKLLGVQMHWAQMTERHSDMLDFAKKLVVLAGDEGFELTLGERNSISYKLILLRQKVNWVVRNLME